MELEELKLTTATEWKKKEKEVDDLKRKHSTLVEVDRKLIESFGMMEKQIADMEAKITNRQLQVEMQKTLHWPPRP